MANKMIKLDFFLSILSRKHTMIMNETQLNVKDIWPLPITMMFKSQEQFRQKSCSHKGCGISKTKKSNIDI